MQTSNASQESRANDSEWYLLGEYSLSVFLSDHENGGDLTAELLFQTMRELGIPIEYLENIGIPLTGFAEEALVHSEKESLELPGRIRVFCQKRIIDAANSAKISRQTMEQAQIIHPSGARMNEGWGYYVIERDRDFSSDPCKESCRVIDLYLYKEGK